MPTSPRRRKPDPPSPPAAPTSDASDAVLPEDAPPPWRDPDGREAVPHGFRSSFSTWCDDVLPHEREAAERALAHEVANKASAVYRRSDMLNRRIALMNDWAEHCTSASRTGIARRGVIR
jgi:integrase